MRKPGILSALTFAAILAAIGVFLWTWSRGHPSLPLLAAVVVSLISYCVYFVRPKSGS